MKFSEKILRKIISSYYNFRETFSDSIDSAAENAKKKPSTETIDTTDIQGIGSSFSGVDQNPDEILQKKGVAIYDEMEDKDPHLYSVYQTRKKSIAMTPWDVIPADETPRALEIRDFIFDMLDGIKGSLTEDIQQLCDAIGKGFSILEIVWKLSTKGKWKGKFIISELIFHKQRYWFFKDRRWHKAEETVYLFGSKPTDAKPVPWEKIVHYAYNSNDNMYGRAAFKPIYWFYWFKKEGWKSWIVFLNKYGTPTVLGTYPKTAKAADQSKLKEIVERIQEETGVIIPEGMKISFLEATHAGTASYKELNESVNAEESKAILGATQTVEEGKRGSYALSRSHSEVRRERVEADAVEISDVIQEQIVKRAVDFNYETEVYPQFIMKVFAGRDTGIPSRPRKKDPIAKLPEAPVGAPVEAPVADEGMPAKPVIPEEPTGMPVGEELVKKQTPEKIEKTSEDLKSAFKKIESMVLKNHIKNPDKLPVINMGEIKNVLAEKVREDYLYNLMGNIKTFIENEIDMRIDRNEEYDFYDIENILDEARNKLEEIIEIK